MAILPRPAHIVLDYLKGAGTAAWLDSGTLLGIYRDGALLARDGDIDLSVLSRENQEAETLLAFIRQTSLAYREFRHSGKLFKIKLTQVGMRPIDINIFREQGGNLVCPAVRAKSIKHAWAAGMPAFKLPWMYVVRHIRQYRRVLEVTALPWAEVLHHALWSMPTTLVIPTTVMDCTTRLPIPAQVEEYLAYRYGDWKVPRTDWNYAEDDGGYQRSATFDA